MAKLAFMTIGVLHEPMGHPRVQGFMDRFEAVFASAEGSDGFIDRSRRTEYPAGAHSWGPIVAPKCHAQIDDPMRLPSTLSLWDDLESVAAYAYRGTHGEAMAKRREWFLDSDAPTYVAWWVEDGHTPDWTEAGERMDHLHEHGPTPFAFDFKSPFDVSGNAVSVERDKVNSKRAINETRFAEAT